MSSKNTVDSNNENTFALAEKNAPSTDTLSEISELPTDFQLKSDRKFLLILFFYLDQKFMIKFFVKWNQENDEGIEEELDSMSIATENEGNKCKFYAVITQVEQMYKEKLQAQLFQLILRQYPLSQVFILTTSSLG